MIHFKTLATVALLCCTFWLPVACQAFEPSSCVESWFDASLEDSIANDRAPDRKRDCPDTTDDGIVGDTGYRIIDGRAYWYSVSSNRSSPCSGQGVGALGQMFDPVCYLPSKLQVHHTSEERKFWLVSNDGVHFRVASVLSLK